MKTKAWERERGGKWGIKKKENKRKGSKDSKGWGNDRFILNYKSLAIIYDSFFFSFSCFTRG